MHTENLLGHCRKMLNLTQLNYDLFKMIYMTGRHSEFALSAALFFSHYLTTILAVILLFSMALRKSYPILFLKALLLTLCASLLNYIFDHTFDFPRPFTLGLSQNHIKHSNNNSFPSSHMLVMSTIAFAYCFSSKFWIGCGLLLAALAVGWSRIYLGVHFPFDILGALLIALGLNFVAYQTLKKYPRWIG